jgi:hypothetical protein
MPWRRWLAYGLGGLAFVWAVAFVDLTLRARTAFLEGEKYMLWHEKPELKKASLDAELLSREKALRDEAVRDAWPAEKLEQRLFLARFQRDERMKESSLKYAYVWYKTALELFTPPESKWVKLCRAKAPAAKELWKKELDAQKIPYEEYMLE